MSDCTDSCFPFFRPIQARHECPEPLTGAQRRGCPLSRAVGLRVIHGQLPGVAQFGRSVNCDIPRPRSQPRSRTGGLDIGRVLLRFFPGPVARQTSFEFYEAPATDRGRCPPAE